MLSAAAGALKPGGCLAFTLEHLADVRAGYGLSTPITWPVRSLGRLCTPKGGSQGLQLRSLQHVVLRREGGQDVSGLVVVAIRSG